MTWHTDPSPGRGLGIALAVMLGAFLTAAVMLAAWPAARIGLMEVIYG